MLCSVTGGTVHLENKNEKNNLSSPPTFFRSSVPFEKGIQMKAEEAEGQRVKGGWATGTAGQRGTAPSSSYSPLDSHSRGEGAEYVKQRKRRQRPANLQQGDPPGEASCRPRRERAQAHFVLRPFLPLHAAHSAPHADVGRTEREVESATENPSAAVVTLHAGAAKAQTSKARTRSRTDGATLPAASGWRRGGKARVVTGGCSAGPFAGTRRLPARVATAPAQPRRQGSFGRGSFYFIFYLNGKHFVGVNPKPWCPSV